ncbi:MAG: hypothetical protein Gaeavirus7_23 [Gaeavirus sp.]|uniref:FNIP repeat-containing protein n=1 Tax=Gaeavirus sp. TaxID=2487767 RepID=A0A3G4ZYQ7_9VIRU|nr:MAG: hypothetical protein Gaeavirus7_23 [Gaeavirus sp.]
MYNIERYYNRDKTELRFKRTFIKSLDGIIFSEKLQCITFSVYYNKSLDNVIFPDSLQKIIFGRKFNKSIDTLGATKNSSNLHTIIFGHNFNQPLNNLPSSIEHLTFHIPHNIREHNKSTILTKDNQNN